MPFCNRPKIDDWVRHRDWAQKDCSMLRKICLCFSNPKNKSWTPSSTTISSAGDRQKSRNQNSWKRVNMLSLMLCSKIWKMQLNHKDSTILINLLEKWNKKTKYLSPFYVISFWKTIKKSISLLIYLLTKVFLSIFGVSSFSSHILATWWKTSLSLITLLHFSAMPTSTIRLTLSKSSMSSMPKTST